MIVIECTGELHPGSELLVVVQGFVEIGSVRFVAVGAQGALRPSLRSRDLALLTLLSFIQVIDYVIVVILPVVEQIFILQEFRPGK